MHASSRSIALIAGWVLALGVLVSGDQTFVPPPAESRAPVVEFARTQPAPQASRRLTVDSSTSQIAILVGRSGVFGFAGHDHEVVGPIGSGEIVLDPGDLARSSLSLTISTRSLHVTGKGEPQKDVAEVQSTMERDVLDVARYPAIRFESRHVNVTSASEAAPSLAVTGELTLHGATRSITVPAQVRLVGRTLTATGTFRIKQTEFGITPVSAAGGTVKVKDELRVTFKIVASSQ